LFIIIIIIIAIVSIKSQPDRQKPAVACECCLVSLTADFVISPVYSTSYVSSSWHVILQL